MKKLSSKHLGIISKVFAISTLVTLAVQIGLDWKNYFQHPYVLWLPLIFMFTAIIFMKKAESKKKEEGSNNKQQ